MLGSPSQSERVKFFTRYPFVRRPEKERPAFWWFRYVPAVILSAVVLGLLYAAGRVALVPVLVSLALAYLLNPIVERFQRAGLGREPAALAAMALVTLGMVAFGMFVIPDLWAESVAMGERLMNSMTPANAQKVRTELRHFSPMLDQLFGARIADIVRNPNAVLQGRWTAGLATGFLSTASASLDLLVVPFFVFYILVDFGDWRNGFEDLIPPRFRDPFRRLFDEVGRILQSYVLGQLLIAMAMSVGYGIGFALLRVPAWAGLAALSGLLNMVPYVGTLTGLVMACGFRYAHGGGWWEIGGIILVFILVQSMEGYVLTPRILGGRLSLHPMAVFLGLLIFGKLFGFLGILLAVPVIAVAQVFLKLFRELYKASYFYHKGEVPPDEQPPEEVEARLAIAAESVLAEQVEKQKGDELLAPERSEDDPAASEKVH